MKAIVSTLLIFSSLLVPTSGQALQNKDIIGAWKYVSYMYHNQRQPNPHPDLQLSFTFSLDGTEVLYWSEKGQPGFCEATATYEIKNDTQLVSTVTKTNPKNNIDCGEDPDMQVGKQSFVPIELKNNQLYLNIGLSGEDFFYVLDKETQNGGRSGSL